MAYDDKILSLVFHIEDLHLRNMLTGIMGASTHENLANCWVHPICTLQLVLNFQGRLDGSNWGPLSGSSIGLMRSFNSPESLNVHKSLVAPRGLSPHSLPPGSTETRSVKVPSLLEHSSIQAVSQIPSCRHLILTAVHMSVVS